MRQCPRCGVQLHPAAPSCPRCNFHFDSWVSRHALLVILVAIAAVIVAVYIGFHAHKYGDCAHAPGLLNWPSSCPSG